MIIHSNLSKMKIKILPTCLQGNYSDSLGEFSKASYGVFGAEVNNIRCIMLLAKCNHLNLGHFLNLFLRESVMRFTQQIYK